MSESRKIHQPDGEQTRDGDHVALDGDKEFRNSRLSLTKEKASPDGAHEKLLQKEDEAKIVRDMRVDIVDAKYVSGDHRNGDPKIELDANKKQFSGLTKEELMKYADDPFWVNLRWFMFVLFWALWLGMLAGAIAIIVNAPKCALPASKTWFEKGPLVEVGSCNLAEVEGHFPLLQSSKVEGLFCSAPTYDALDDPNVLTQFKEFVETAKKFSVKVIVDLIPNYVSSSHPWFVASENGTAPYRDYFVWAVGKDFDSANKPNVPNNWASTLNTSAWTWSDKRQAYYLHQYEEEHPDLDFNNQQVVALFSEVVKKWIAAGASGIRLNKARLMLVDAALPGELQAAGRGASPAAGHQHYAYYRHAATADQPGLQDLFNKFQAVADETAGSTEDTVFTLKEEGDLTELYLLGGSNGTKLRPPSAAPVAVRDAAAAAAHLNRKVKGRWPMVQLTSEPDAEKELAFFALLLPAVPVFDIEQLDNDTNSESLSHLASLRSDGSVEHGHAAVAPVPAAGQAGGSALAVARWKPGHTGYVAVFNPGAQQLRANLTALPSVPAALTVHHVSHAVKAATNYTNNYSEDADNVLVPSYSTVVLSYVPQSSAEN